MSLHLPIRCATAAAVACSRITAAPAAGASEKVYGGHTTTQSAPFGLRVGADGRTLTGLLIQVDFDCDAGYGASWSGAASFRSFTPGSVQLEDNLFNPTRTASDGTFSSTGEAAGRYGEDDVGTITETISGKLRRDTAVGTYSATLVLRNAATGATNATCQSARATGARPRSCGSAGPRRARAAARTRSEGDQLPDRPQRPLRRSLDRQGAALHGPGEDPRLARLGRVRGRRDAHRPRRRRGVRRALQEQAREVVGAL